jgi:hypothetical protein
MADIPNCYYAREYHLYFETCITKIQLAFCASRANIPREVRNLTCRFLVYSQKQMAGAAFGPDPDRSKWDIHIARPLRAFQPPETRMGESCMVLVIKSPARPSRNRAQSLVRGLRMVNLGAFLSIDLLVNEAKRIKYVPAGCLENPRHEIAQIIHRKIRNLSMMREPAYCSLLKCSEKVHGMQKYCQQHIQ